MIKTLKKITVFLVMIATHITFALPKGFVYVKNTNIVCDIRYATTNNFAEQKIDGYKSNKCILTKEAANALVAVQKELDSLKPGYKLHIFDAYRPLDAVKHFVRWSKEASNKHIKQKYYPDFKKEQLFELGYIALSSSHSRGSTVDLTICEYVDGKYNDIEMGTIFDFFGERSHTEYKNISIEAQKNRIFLKNLMEKHGFKNFEKEWWHYTLGNEPFPDKSFNFYVE